MDNSFNHSPETSVLLPLLSPLHAGCWRHLSCKPRGGSQSPHHPARHERLPLTGTSPVGAVSGLSHGRAMQPSWSPLGLNSSFPWATMDHLRHETPSLPAQPGRAPLPSADAFMAAMQSERVIAMWQRFRVTHAEQHLAALNTHDLPGCARASHRQHCLLLLSPSPFPSSLPSFHFACV